MLPRDSVYPICVRASFALVVLPAGAVSFGVAGGIEDGDDGSGSSHRLCSFGGAAWSAARQEGRRKVGGAGSDGDRGSGGAVSGTNSDGGRQ